jgi:hypothetical protein
MWCIEVIDSPVATRMRAQGRLPAEEVRVGHASADSRIDAALFDWAAMSAVVIRQVG